jgi:hypothetical protein
MYPVYDDDAALLLSLTVAAKRRPAALDEIITALAMAQHGEIPAKSKLVDAFARMGVCGLIMNRTQPLAIIESHCIQGGKVEVSNFVSKLFGRYRDGR